MKKKCGQCKTQTADYCFHHANENATTIVPLFSNPKNNSPQSVRSLHFTLPPKKCLLCTLKINQRYTDIHSRTKTLPACICQIDTFICALSLQLYRCGLRLEEISDQLGSATPTNRVPNHEGRRNSYSELLNRLSNIPVLCLCRVSLL